MARTNKPYTFGMELEVNYHERKDEIVEFDWMNAAEAGWENSVIKEYRTTPCDGLKFMRRATVLGHMLGFDYQEGEHDDYAESFHLHIGNIQSSPNIHTNHHELYMRDVHSTIPLLSAAHHLSRGGSRWRDSAPRWAKLDNRFGDRMCYMPNGRGWWMANNHLGTTEVRLNENPAPLIPVLMLPVVVSEKFQGQHHPANMRVSHEVPPSQVAEAAKEALGEDVFMDFIRECKRHWRNPLATKLLNMFVEGASHIDTWRAADEYYTANSKEYNTMMNQLGGRTCAAS